MNIHELTRESHRAGDLLSWCDGCVVIRHIGEVLIVMLVGRLVNETSSTGLRK